MRSVVEKAKQGEVKAVSISRPIVAQPKSADESSSKTQISPPVSPASQIEEVEELVGTIKVTDDNGGFYLYDKPSVSNNKQSVSIKKGETKTFNVYQVSGSWYYIDVDNDNSPDGRMEESTAQVQFDISAVPLTR